MCITFIVIWLACLLCKIPAVPPIPHPCVRSKWTAQLKKEGGSYIGRRKGNCTSTLRYVPWPPPCSMLKPRFKIIHRQVRRQGSNDVLRLFVHGKTGMIRYQTIIIIAIKYTKKCVRCFSTQYVQFQYVCAYVH